MFRVALMTDLIPSGERTQWKRQLVKANVFKEGNMCSCMRWTIYLECPRWESQMSTLLNDRSFNWGARKYSHIHVATCLSAHRKYCNFCAVIALISLDVGWLWGGSKINFERESDTRLVSSDKTNRKLVHGRRCCLTGPESSCRWERRFWCKFGECRSNPPRKSRRSTRNEVILEPIVVIVLSTWSPSGIESMWTPLGQNVSKVSRFWKEEICFKYMVLTGSVGVSGELYTGVLLKVREIRRHRALLAARILKRHWRTSKQEI